jgi:hypothetical protein
MPETMGENPIDETMPETPVDETVPDIPVDENMPEIPIDEATPDISIDETMPETPIDETIPDIPIDETMPGTPIDETTDETPVDDMDMEEEFDLESLDLAEPASAEAIAALIQAVVQQMADEPETLMRLIPMLAIAMNLTAEDEAAIAALSPLIDPVEFGYEAGDGALSEDAARATVATAAVLSSRVYALEYPSTADEASQALGMAEGTCIMLFGRDTCEGSRGMLLRLPPATDPAGRNDTINVTFNVMANVTTNGSTNGTTNAMETLLGGYVNVAVALFGMEQNVTTFVDIWMQMVGVTREYSEDIFALAQVGGGACVVWPVCALWAMCVL